jgi:hypothetical protein
MIGGDNGIFEIFVFLNGHLSTGVNYSLFYFIGSPAGKNKLFNVLTDFCAQAVKRNTLILSSGYEYNFLLK